MKTTLAQKMLEIALTQRGVEEKPRGSNRGPMVDQYQAATELEKKFWGPWCAAFVCWCMREAMEAAKAAGRKFTFKRMTTAAVRFMRSWSMRQDASTHTLDNPGRDIEPGDLLVYTWSHTGIAKTRPDAKGLLIAVEGNTNEDGGREGYAVMEHPRHIRSVKCRIRLMV